MTTPSYSPNYQTFSIPYLTLPEYKQAPTGIDYDNLVTNSINPEVQDAELSNVIARASSWCDTFCNQILGATEETESQRVRTTNDGNLVVHPYNSPIIAVTSLSYGSDPINLVTATDLNTIWYEPGQFIYPYGTLPLQYSSQGPLSFGFPGAPRQKNYVRYTYINGYVNTRTDVAEAGDSFLTVRNAMGIRPGDQLKIYDSDKTENITVANNYVFGSLLVPTVTPLVYDHDVNTSISALPPAIKQAAILMTTAYLKVRGDNSMVMQITQQAATAYPGSSGIPTEVAMAKELLQPFRRII